MTPSNLFQHYVGIDYSGAETPVSRLKGLQVFCATVNKEPTKMITPKGDRLNWTRSEIAHWCAEHLLKKSPIIIGIDHGFSFPMSYMTRYGISDWNHFLEDFRQHWPTDEDDTKVEDIRNNNPRNGERTEFRLTEKWTSSAKSVFQLDGPGQVGKSTHAGIPWIRFLRQNPQIKKRVHFWPFDGFELSPNASVIAEVYPAIFRNRYQRYDRTGHEQDAWSIAKWLKEMDCRGVLDRYFNPPLSPPERKQAQLEGWILGVY